MHEEQTAAAEGVELQEDALQRPWRQHAQYAQRSDDRRWLETANGLKDPASEEDLDGRGENRVVAIQDQPGRKDSEQQ